MTHKTFRLVRNHDVARFERAGWIPRESLVGTHHGAWSTLMEADDEIAELAVAAIALGDEVALRNFERSP